MTTITNTHDSDTLHEDASTEEPQKGMLSSINKTLGNVRLKDRSGERAAKKVDRSVRKAQGKARPRAFSLVLFSAALRLANILAVVLMTYATVFGFIPFIGGWVRAVVGEQALTTTVDNLIAVWFLPYAFLVGLMFVAEVTVIRVMWRASSRLIGRWKEQLRTARDEFAAELEAQKKLAARTPAKTTNRTSKSKGKK